MTDQHEPNVRAHSIGKFEDFEENSVTKVTIEGIPIAVAYVENELYAIADTCSHADYSLSEGELHPLECALECPKHGALFSLRSGEPLSLPATQPVHAYTVEIYHGEVVVSVPDASDDANGSGDDSSTDDSSKDGS